MSEIPGYRPFEELKQYYPNVIFIFDDTRNTGDWEKFLAQVIIDFLCFCNQEKNAVAMARRERSEYRWNERSGLSEIHIGNNYVALCKMFLYHGLDHGEPMNNWEPCRGVRFVDHAGGIDQECNTRKVFLVADAFETFLKENNITFTRKNSTIK